MCLKVQAGFLISQLSRAWFLEVGMWRIVAKTLAAWVSLAVVLIVCGGLFYDSIACGGLNKCGDDLGGGLVMVVGGLISIAVSFFVSVVYFFVLIRKSK
jgi:hypothetical protein